ncbi:peptide/nickel transport system permease protein [Actinomadura meyerae]|uniref:Peptide/nickel transport system permease protein n=1 Tax=Actinomadura meyerae TaxID=240840 RepID=A0A239NFY1_9ACTN|nr:ABC transporter permease [Actinomadura meyerae]SNT53680.1 peptide/nickel transport system permease protein [Actinomadura meyerae]
MAATARWLVRRLLLSVLVTLGAVTAAFAGLHLTPGDPARVMLGGASASPELVAQVRLELGLDRPLIVQYGAYLADLLRGDLGRSYQLQEPVARVIGTQLWPTVELGLAGLAVAALLALALAVATAGRRRRLRALATAFELTMASSPSFWIGVLLLALFAFRWQLFPASGGAGPASLVLPALTLGLSLAGVFAQVLREGLERALEEPFVLSARTRGSGDTAVLLRHALRHALLPTITLAGWAFGALLSGAVVIETIFNRQGLGRVMITAIGGRDLPVVTGVVIVAAVAFTVINLLVDWLYRVIDPRLAAAAR